MSGENKIMILIADDDLIAREGLKRIIETTDDMVIIGEEKTAQIISKRVLELSPDILLIDLKWYGDETAGTTAIREVKRVSPETHILAVTGHADLIEDARRAGADAAVTKNFTIETLLSLLRGLHTAQNDFAPSSPPAAEASVEKLTSRELEVLGLLAKGHSDKEIGQNLGIAENTVKNHVRQILAKLDAKNRTHAASQARELGLLN